MDTIQIQSYLPIHANTPTGVPRLVRALNRQRTHNVNVGSAYPFLAGSLLSMLNQCLEHNDVDAVLNAMMLAQVLFVFGVLFHKMAEFATLTLSNPHT